MKEKDVKTANKSKIAKFLFAFTIICLIVYSIYNIISQQAQIAEVKKQKEQLNDKIAVAEQQHDDYIKLLEDDKEAEYMESIAVNKLGYAYPDERRFYIIATDEDDE